MKEKEAILYREKAPGLGKLSMSFLKRWKKDVSSLKKKPYGIAPAIVVPSQNIIKHLEVSIDESHKIWKPNEFVSGESILLLNGDITNVSIRLSLISEIQLKNAKNPSLRNKVSEVILEKSTYIYGNPSKIADVGDIDMVHNGLTKGEHIFPFRIKIPANKSVFSSINFERGSISFYLQVVVVSMNNIDRPLSKANTRFKVVVPMDVAPFAQGRSKTVVLQSALAVLHPHHNNTDSNSSSSSSNIPHNKQGEDTTSLVMSKVTNTSTNSNTSTEDTAVNTLTRNVSPNKTATISVNLPHSGFKIGELIPVKVDVDYYKDFHHSAGLITTLVRICRVNGANSDEILETYRKDICQSVSPLYIDPETHNASITVYLKVPIDAFSTFTSLQKFFTFQYYVEVLVNLSRKNMVYTESNRLLGRATENSKSFDSSATMISQNFQNISRNFSKMVSSNDQYMDSNEIESNLLFHDMVNVEKLKRLRNVTGMSVEVIIGSVRNEKDQLLVPDTTQLQKSLSNQASEFSILSNLPQEQEEDLNDWLLSPELFNLQNPVPEYTPNEKIEVSPDKEELERSRLKTLESDPPISNY